MGNVVLVYDYVSKAIHKLIDAALEDAPPEAADSRQAMFHTLLEYYNEHGDLPPLESLSIVRRDENPG